MNLYLDDVRNPEMSMLYTYDSRYVNLKWTVVKNYEQFCDTVTEYYNTTKTIPELISFDFDLGMKVKETGLIVIATEEVAPTGMDCCKFLVNFCLDNNIKTPINFLIHSQNPVGAGHMKSYLSNYNRVL